MDVHLIMFTYYLKKIFDKRSGTYGLKTQTFTKKAKMLRLNCNDKSMCLIIYVFVQAMMLTLALAASVTRIALHTLPQVEPTSRNLHTVVRPLNNDLAKSNKNVSTGNNTFRKSTFSYREDVQKLYNFDRKIQHHNHEAENRAKQEDIGGGTKQENTHSNVRVGTLCNAYINQTNILRLYVQNYPEFFL